MRDIDIRINKARILGYTVGMNEELPTVAARVGLYHNDHCVSEFSLSSELWTSGLKFEVPLSMVELLVKIGRELERVLVATVRSSVAEIAAPAESEDIPI